MARLWNTCLSHKVKWLPTIIFIPLIYLLGWLIVQPLRLLGIGLLERNISLIGSIISLIIFFSLLQSWVNIRWTNSSYLKEINSFNLNNNNALLKFSRGLKQSLCMIFLLLIFLNSLSLLSWKFYFEINTLVNAFFLCFLVGIGEELIFRGWLWGEMNLLFGPRRGKIFQALIYSIAHCKLSEEVLSNLLIFIGLFLLGLVLAQRRNLDSGSLWGCVGLHGGLVSIWFLVQANFISFPLNIPIWLVGPGGLSPNPIGSLLAIIFFLFILLFYRDKEIALQRSLLSTVKASSKGAFP